jgi:hypothetical protein
MTYKAKRTRGRPKEIYKIRSIKGITPKGFVFQSISLQDKKIRFERKKKHEK